MLYTKIAECYLRLRFILLYNFKVELFVNFLFLFDGIVVKMNMCNVCESFVCDLC